MIVDVADLFHELVADFKHLAGGRLSAGDHQHAGEFFVEPFLEEVVVLVELVPLSFVVSEVEVPQFQNDGCRFGRLVGGDDSLFEEHGGPGDGDPIHIARLVEFVDSFDPIGCGFGGRGCGPLGRRGFGFFA